MLFSKAMELGLQQLFVLHRYKQSFTNSVNKSKEKGKRDIFHEKIKKK